MAADTGFFSVFAWSLRSTEGRSVDTFRQIDLNDRARLEHHGFARTALNSDAFRNQLKNHALWMLGEVEAKAKFHSQHGQAKFSENGMLSHESNVIRSVAKSRSAGSMDCAEMRKVFTEKRHADGWLTEDVARTWQRVGLSEKSPVMPLQTQVTTKGFLLIDLQAQVSRLYVYQEVDQHPMSELVEITVSCRF